MARSVGIGKEVRHNAKEAHLNIFESACNQDGHTSCFRVLRARKIAAMGEHEGSRQEGAPRMNDF